MGLGSGCAADNSGAFLPTRASIVLPATRNRPRESPRGSPVDTFQERPLEVSARSLPPVPGRMRSPAEPAPYFPTW